jgi:hypothetical protein
MRRVFTISDVSTINSSIFHMDYDDSFVAYLNGVEIARENIGQEGIPPAYSDFASDLHEAVMYTGGLPDQFVLSADQVGLLQNGENVLAVQVHNATDNSSDMSAIPFLNLGITTDVYDYQEIPEWFDPPVCPENLSPVNVIINTGAWGNEVSWEIVNDNNEVVFTDSDYQDNTSYEHPICIEQGCYTFVMIDSFGDGWNGAEFFVVNEMQETILSGFLDQGYEASLVLAIENFCPVEGCFEEGAINFNPYANIDDGSCIHFQSSNLPIVVIDTQGQNIMDDPRITAHMGIIHNSDGINTLGDPFNNYDGQISIEYRGSSSQMFPKKPYALETQDSLGNNNNVSLIDMPVENDWILYPPYSDKTLMRNTLTFDLGRKAGRYAPRTKYCELVVNDEYRGIYILMESIKRDDDRVDIATLLPDDNEGDELTGGYILKVDKFTGGGNGSGWSSNYLYEGQNDFLYLQFHRPKGEDLSDPQKDYIESYCHDFENALAGNNFEDPVEGYLPFIDVPSFIDLSLINELSKNIDGYRLSTYFYKDKDSNGGKITMGPWWDYNLSFGNADYCSGEWTDGWEVDGGCGDTNPFWFERLLEDELYRNKMRCRWEKLRANEWSDENVQFIIDSISDYVSDAAVRNFAKWNTLGEYVWPNTYTDSEVYQDEVDWLLTWTQGRLEWIDNNLEGTCILGCTDPLACNFWAEALCDDGSCEYTIEYEIDGELAPTVFETYTYSYPSTVGSSYIWTSVNGIIESGQGTSTVEVSWLSAGNGQLFVQETTSDGCSGDTVQLDVNAIGPVDITGISAFEIRVYPNPNYGSFTVDMGTSYNVLNVEIITPSGQKVFSSSFENKQSLHLEPNLAAGVYYLKLWSEQMTFGKKLVIK